ncbi:MAG: hypothetical protein QOG52_724 [Frankiaceae bacterium]|nr:hypothetical protein [Frankiaceae bacterium]
MAPVRGRAPAARPQLLREMNEQVLLDLIRADGPLSRADLARMTGLSKPTVSLALANIERAGLVRAAGVRTGVPGPAAILYEVRPDCGYVLGLDVGRQFMRAAVADMSGAVRARRSIPVTATDGPSRVAELTALAAGVLDESNVTQADITQTVIGSPGVYDPQRDALALSGSLPGWGVPAVLSELRTAFGPSVMIENDLNVAALAERAHGHGRDVHSFAFVSIGTGIGMGLVIDGTLHRGAHGTAGEIGYLPFSEGHGADDEDARERGSFEAASSAAAVVRAAQRAGLDETWSARDVFAAALDGNAAAAAVVAEQALLVAKAICAVITVVDPELIVLGGGIGQAPGFVDAVAAELKAFAPVIPEVRVSALGADAVLDGCLAAGLDRAWALLTAAVPGPGL